VRGSKYPQNRFGPTFPGGGRTLAASNTGGGVARRGGGDVPNPQAFALLADVTFGLKCTTSAA